LNGRDIDRVLIWAGATLQAPPSRHGGATRIAPYGVFVSFSSTDSPARTTAMVRGRRITKWYGQPSPSRRLHQGGERQTDRASLRLQDDQLNARPT